MMIQSRQPKVSLTLKKVQRRLGAERVSFLFGNRIDDIDLSGFLGENGSVIVSRGLDRTGVFDIVLTDRMDIASQDSLYALVEPMDIIEIRMGQNPSTNELPIVMRGIVSVVTRNESIGNDGRPSRSVHVSGHDFGKFLDMMQISYQKDYIYRNFIIPSMPMYARYALWLDKTASGFVETVMDRLVTGKDSFLSELFFDSGLKDAVAFKVDAKNVKHARVGPFGLSKFEGTAMQLLTNWTDLDWNELFIEDRVDAAYLVYRPKPFFHIRSSDLILKDYGAVATDPFKVDISDVDHLQLSRADTSVANFYQVDAPQAEFINLDEIRTQALRHGLIYILDHPNCSPSVYGLKRMTRQTMQGPDGQYTRALAMGKDDKAALSSSMGTWYEARRDQLKLLNRDNVVFESGSLTMKGDERLRPGVYIRLRRGSMYSRFYVVNVTHQMMPFRTFKTTLQLERGESYADRLAMTDSPYWSEAGGGVYG